MNSIETAIIAIFLASTTLTALCGMRIYPMILPDDCQYPAISYQRISETPDYTLDGPGTFDEVRLQIDCWAETALQTRALADVIRTSIDGLSGTCSGLTIWNAMRDNAQDFYEPDHRLYRHSVDYRIQFALP